MRIGLMTPHNDMTTEWDLQRVHAGTHVVHTQRLWLPEVSAAAEETMLREEVPRAAAYLDGVGADVVVFGCTSAGAIRGPEGEERFTAWLAERMGAPVVSAFASVRRVLARSAGPVSIVTPYSTPLHTSVLDSFAAAGVSIRDGGCMGLDDDRRIGRVTPAQLIAFATERLASGPKPERVFISCTNLRAAECAETLERRLGCPVTSSNLAILDNLRPYLEKEPPHGAGV
jgi:maleate isomerase